MNSPYLCLLTYHPMVISEYQSLMAVLIMVQQFCSISDRSEDLHVMPTFSHHFFEYAIIPTQQNALKGIYKIHFTTVELKYSCSLLC